MKSDQGGVGEVAPAPSHGSDCLTALDLSRLAKVLLREAGIDLPPGKETMAEGRIRRLARDLGLTSIRNYCDQVLVGNPAPHERQRLVDALTTHETSFFRERRHFEFLQHEVLPMFKNRKITVWSAGCSTGEEAWSLAMVLATHASRSIGFDFEILATDVSVQSLRQAARAVYKECDVEPIPPSMRSMFLLRSKSREKQLVRIIPELREKIRFVRVNLVAPVQEIAPCSDIVFCRNVMIYFDQQRRRLLLDRLVDALLPGGYLFVGHSEALLEHDYPLTGAGPTIYRRADI